MHIRFILNNPKSIFILRQFKKKNKNLKDHSYLKEIKN